ncbi:hypothetical protein B0A50_06540 [Salinomyces thailandicus]|uniref:Mitochondrial carrier protein n=1 Tax=Salinomyces thailandicus TaxID=706561 RepID=A0A4U0TNW5_9PEZI|nr:hypothetical protein B0A50_06540 [Salinomyces thailandica]
MTDAVAAAPLPPIIREGGRADRQPQKKSQDNASTGVGAATMRVLTARFLTFYFRAPIKAFFRSRVDYMGYARAINPRVQAGEAWTWRMSSPALLASAVHRYGWSFLPNQVLPPLLANTVVGAVLYTGYLQTLGVLHEPSARATKRVDPLPPPSKTFAAGLVAGSIQSLLAAPLDALQVRFKATDMMNAKYSNMWQYAYQKTAEIGSRGIFAGWTLSFLRDAVGNAAFFATFEYVKGQAFYSFVSNFYGHYGKLTGAQQENIKSQSGIAGSPVIKPHYMLEPTFLALAGVAASVVQALIQYPVSRVQEVHYGRLTWIDAHPREIKKDLSLHASAIRLYASAYRKTFKQVWVAARKDGGLRRWLYRDFLLRTVTQTPSTAAGLIVFEVIRRRWGDDSDVVKINKDGYDILLV